MDGLTVAEMAEKLNITPEAVRKRLERAGIQAKTREAIYDRSALATIREAHGRGRPRKSKE